MKFCATIVSACALAAGAHGATHNFAFPIDASQEVPPNGSAATGFGFVTYDDVTNMLDWDLSWSGLEGTITAMHFHGPAGFGVNAGVQVNVGGISGLTSPSIGSTPITAIQGDEVIAGNWYVNIHSQTFPGGEIRGQVVPAPASLALLGIGGIAATRRRR